MVNFWFDGSKANLIKTLIKDISDEERRTCCIEKNKVND